MRKRIAVATLTLSAAAFVDRMATEGYTDTPVIPVQGDRLTIGFGTANNVKATDKTTPIPAMQRALRDFQGFEARFKQCVHVPLYQGEYDNYVKFMYNIGPHNFCSSTVVKRLNREDYAGACEAVLMWKYAGGFDCSTPGNKRCAGVWTDRLKTYETCKSELQ